MIYFDVLCSVRATNLQTTAIFGIEGVPEECCCVVETTSILSPFIFANLLSRIDINLDLNFVAPSTVEFHFRPCSLDINLKYELADFADANSVHW